MPLVTRAICELNVMKYCALGFPQQIFEEKENLTRVIKAPLKINAHHTSGTSA